jgi:hypothetical protein
MIEPCKPLSVSMTGYGRELLSGPIKCWRNSPLCRSSNCPMTPCEALEGWATNKMGLAACRNLAGKLYSVTHSLKGSDGALSQSVQAKRSLA